MSTIVKHTLSKLNGYLLKLLFLSDSGYIMPCFVHSKRVAIYEIVVVCDLRFVYIYLRNTLRNVMRVRGDLDGVELLDSGKFFKGQAL